METQRSFLSAACARAPAISMPSRIQLRFDSAHLSSLCSASTDISPHSSRRERCCCRALRDHKRWPVGQQSLADVKLGTVERRAVIDAAYGLAGLSCPCDSEESLHLRPMVFCVHKGDVARAFRGLQTSKKTGSEGGNCWARTADCYERSTAGSKQHPVLHAASTSRISR